MLSGWVVIGRLLLTALLSGAIGWERQVRGRPAGLRTHLMVGLGAALMMLTSIHLIDAFPGQAVDPARIAAQVVTGIGFIGAGTIIRFGGSIRGLTTAASIWAVSGIGLAVGSGFYFGAVATTVIMLFILVGLARMEERIKGETGSFRNPSPFLKQGGSHAEQTQEE